MLIFRVTWPRTGRIVTQWPYCKQSKDWRRQTSLQPLVLRSEISFFWRTSCARDFYSLCHVCETNKVPNNFFFLFLKKFIIPSSNTAISSQSRFSPLSNAVHYYQRRNQDFFPKLFAWLEFRFRHRVWVLSYLIDTEIRHIGVCSKMILQSSSKVGLT